MRSSGQGLGFGLGLGVRVGLGFGVTCEELGRSREEEPLERGETERVGLVTRQGLHIPAYGRGDVGQMFGRCGEIYGDPTTSARTCIR